MGHNRVNMIGYAGSVCDTPHPVLPMLIKTTEGFGEYQDVGSNDEECGHVLLPFRAPLAVCSSFRALVCPTFQIKPKRGLPDRLAGTWPVPR